MTDGRVGDDEVLIGMFEASGDRGRLMTAFEAMSAAVGPAGVLREEIVLDSAGTALARVGVAGPARTRAAAALPDGAGGAVLSDAGMAAIGRARLFVDGPGAGAPLESLTRFARDGGFDDGVDGPCAVEGEYAAAFIDAARRRLTLIRDPGGVEALYAMEVAPGAVAFSTTPHALLALPGAPSDPDPEVLRLQAWTSDEMPWRSCWPGIVCIAPGGRIAASAAGMTRGRWWRPAPDPDLASLNEAAFVEAFTDRARSAAALRWASDPAARALVYSGGLDSSLLLAGVASRFPHDAVPLVSVASALPAGAEDLTIQAAAARRFPGTERIVVPAGDLDPLEGAEAAWRRSAAPNMDFFACANLAMARALHDRGFAGGHGGFAGDFAVSVRSTAAVTDALAAGRWGVAARLYSGFRAAGTPRRRFGWHLAARSGATRWITRRPAVWGRPPAPFLASDPGQRARWREAGVDLRPPLAPSLAAQQAAGLRRASAQWPFRFLLGEGAGEVVRVSSLMLDTRLTSAAMAAPAQTALHGGRDRGLTRRALARLGFEEAATRRGKSPLAPEIWGAARVGLAARRQEMRAFQDLPLWRELVDQPRVDALLGRVEDLGDVADLSVLLRAWHFGRFARRAAERR